MSKILLRFIHCLVMRLSKVFIYHKSFYSGQSGIQNLTLLIFTTNQNYVHNTTRVEIIVKNAIAR